MNRERKKREQFTCNSCDDSTKSTRVYVIYRWTPAAQCDKRIMWRLYKQRALIKTETEREREQSGHWAYIIKPDVNALAASAFIPLLL